MIGAVAWAVFGGLLNVTVWELTPLYIAEVVSVWAFGISWLLKSRDLWTKLGRPQPIGATTPISASGPAVEPDGRKEPIEPDQRREADPQREA
jgi:hypothetical protein